MSYDALPTSKQESGGPVSALADRLDEIRASVLVLVGMAMLLSITWVDYVTGTELSFSIFYFLPISIITWRLGGWAGFVFSLLSSAAWYLADTLPGDIYSHPAIPVWNALVRLGFFLLAVVVLSRFRNALIREKDLARKDPLTGLVNGRFFRELMREEIRRSRRYSHTLSLAYIDLDNFKSVNDRFGHAAGDTLLKQVGDSLRTNVRSTDTAARLAGDEFALLMPETGNEVAFVAAERLRGQLVDLMRARGWGVTTSIGLVTYLVAPPSEESALNDADALMYSAKSQGKNRIIARIEPEESIRHREHA